MKNKIMHELPENIKTRIRSKLNYLASVKQTITYKEMVDECDIPQPFSIRKLTNFLSEQGKIRPRRLTGLTSKQQKKVAKLIKTARIAALLPFVIGKG